MLMLEGNAFSSLQVRVGLGASVLLIHPEQHPRNCPVPTPPQLPPPSPAASWVLTG